MNKDEIAEKAVDESIVQSAAKQIAVILNKSARAELIVPILPIIAEACRKAGEKQSEDANKLLNKAFNVITEFGGICSDTRAGWWLKDYDEYLYALTPKETND